MGKVEDFGRAWRVCSLVMIKSVADPTVSTQPAEGFPPLTGLLLHLAQAPRSAQELASVGGEPGVQDVTAELDRLTMHGIITAETVHGSTRWRLRIDHPMFDQLRASLTSAHVCADNATLVHLSTVLSPYVPRDLQLCCNGTSRGSGPVETVGPSVAEAGMWARRLTALTDSDAFIARHFREAFSVWHNAVDHSVLRARNNSTVGAQCAAAVLRISAVRAAGTDRDHPTEQCISGAEWAAATFAVKAQASITAGVASRMFSRAGGVEDSAGEDAGVGLGERLLAAVYTELSSQSQACAEAMEAHPSFAPWRKVAAPNDDIVGLAW